MTDKISPGDMVVLCEGREHPPIKPGRPYRWVGTVVRDGCIPLEGGIAECAVWVPLEKLRLFGPR